MTHPTALAAEYRLALLRFYSSRGLRLLPVYEVTSEGRCACGEQACREPNWGKHPRLGAWQHAATTDLQVLERWHAAWPRSNWAWALDEDTYVLDCDPRNGGPRTDHWLSDLRELGLPEPPATLFQVSGSGGLHAAYRAEGAPSRNGSLVRADGTEVPGVNVKGAGGYVLVAPSNHRSGGLYAWLEPWLDPVPWPELAGFLTRRAARATSASSGGSGSLVDPAPGEQFLDKWYREAPQVACGNQRGWLLSGLGWMRKRGRSDVEMMSLAWAVAQRLVVYDPAEPWTEHHVADLVRDVSERYEATRDGDVVVPAWRPYVVTGGAGPEGNGAAAVVDLGAERERRGTPPPDTDERQRNTDLMNAKTLHAWHGRELLWTPQAGWLHWDERRWEYDAAQRRHGLVAQLAAELWAHQDQVPEAQRQALTDQSRRLESVGGAEACLKFAEHLCYRDLGELDQKPELLNVANGTLELDTGRLRDPAPRDLLTRRCPTEYHEGAASPLLDEYLDVFVPDPDRRTWLWRLLGTCLLGGNPWRLLLFLIGPTTTGKSQLAAALQATLGDYAGVGSASAFRGNLDDRPRPDVLKLLPCRLVVMEETSSHWELHADKLKHLTGEATVSVRGMRSDRFVERVPEFTPLFVANEAPTVKGADPAVQRRLLALEFKHRPEREDPHKRRVFLEDGGVRVALLARLVEGLRDLREHGLDDQPAWLTLATMATFEQMDDVGEFLRSVQEDERLVHTGEGQPLSSYALVGDVHAAYRRWVRDHGDAAQQRDRLGRNKFNERLRSLGFQSVDSGGRRWLGWELRDPAVTWRP